MTKLSNKFSWELPKMSNHIQEQSDVKQHSDGSISMWADSSKESSWVKSYEYDEQSQTLSITFKDGFTAHYPNISKEEAEEFSQSSSKGAFINKNLKGRKYY